MQIYKQQIEHDIYTTEMEARARSVDLGFGGLVHVHEYNGLPVYMPAASHEEYLEWLKPLDQAEVPETQEGSSVDSIEALRAIVREVLDGVRKNNTATDKTSERDGSCHMGSGSTVGTMTKELEGQILKADEEQRMVYGWASVVTEKGEPVVDRQGDVIEPDTLVKAVNNFMEHVRVGKEMHKGDQIGAVIHSMPITKEIGESLGIQSDREGWIVAFKVYNDDVWAKVKSGELAAFSIGGRAVKEDYDA